MSKTNHTRTLETKQGIKVDPKNRGAEPEWIDVHPMAANQAPDYQIHEDEKDLYHVAMTKHVNNPKARRYDEDVHVQSFSKVDYDQMLASGFFDQYDKVEVLHDPTLNGKVPANKSGSLGVTPPIKPGSQQGYTPNPDINKDVDTSGDTGSDNDEDPAPGKVYVSLPAARKKYFKLYGVEADENATIDDLNELIASAPAQD